MPEYQWVAQHDPALHPHAQVCGACGAVVAPGKTADHDTFHQQVEEMLTALCAYGRAISLESGYVPGWIGPLMAHYPGKDVAVVAEEGQAGNDDANLAEHTERIRRQVLGR